MNIAVNTRLLLKHRMEGIAVFTWEICRRLAKQNPEDHFYFFFDRKPDPTFTSIDNVHAIVIKPQARHHLLWTYWFEHALPRAFKKYKIDVFFSPESYLSLKTKVPTILVTHDLCFLHYPSGYKKSHLNYLKKYGPLFHQRADHIIAVSQTTKLDIEKQYSIDPSKISVVYNAPREIFQPLPGSTQHQLKQRLTAGNPYILYVGSIHPRKNIARLIRSFDQLQKTHPTDHRLVLYGRWVFGNKESETSIESSAFSDRILLLGDKDCLVQEIIGAADCLVYPSLYEGFGIPIVEAMACGIPVVTSGRGAMKEVGGDAAIYIDPETVSSIAEGIHHALSFVGTNDSIIHRAHNNCQRFSWDESAAKVNGLIRSLK